MKVRISDRKLKRNAEHVYYEISMLFFVVQELTKRRPPHIYHVNTLLESSGIHLRNLLDFFYTPTSKRSRKDDMLAEDYVTDILFYRKNRTKLKDLSGLKKKVDKQIAHLTYHRSKYNKKTKPWNFEKMYRKLYPTIDAFYMSLPEHRQKWEHFVELKKIIDI